MSELVSPPTTGEISAECPCPEIVASQKNHFGRKCWEWQCDYAHEVLVEGKGMVIECSALHRQCCIDDNTDYFVSSPKIEPLKSFFETTMKYFGIKNSDKGNAETEG